MKLYKRVRFHAAHCLNLPYSSPCNSLHGHTYKAEVIIYTERFKRDMAIDFSKIKKIIKSLDHKNLNDIFENPTAENIVRFLLNRLNKYVTKEKLEYINRIKIRLWETPTSSVEDDVNLRNI